MEDSLGNLAGIWFYEDERRRFVRNYVFRYFVDIELHGYTMYNATEIKNRLALRPLKLKRVINRTSNTIKRAIRIL